MRRFSFLFVFLLLLFSYSKADMSSDISNILNGTINAAPPTFKQIGERGYVGLGSLSYRMNGSNMTIQPFSVTPPSLKMGCGAIDIGFGGINFLGFEYLVQKLQQILQAAPAFAFQLAIEVFVPQVANVLAQINAIADAINSISFSACDATRIVHTAAASIRDAINLGKNEKAGKDTGGGTSPGFWDAMKNAFMDSDFYKRVNTAWNNILNSVSTLKQLFSSNTSSVQGEACVFPKGDTGVGALVSSSSAQKYLTTRALKYISEDAYRLKKILVGNYCVNSGTESDSSGSVGQVPDLGFINNYKRGLEVFIGSNSSLLANNIQYYLTNSSLSYTPFTCSDTIQNIDGKNYDYSYACNLMNNIAKAIVNYYKAISNKGVLDSTSASYINFIASVDSGYIRLIRNAALLNRPELVSGISVDLVEEILYDIVPKYIYDVAAEGCAEALAFIDSVRDSLSKAPANDNNDTHAASPVVSAVVSNLKSMKDNVTRHCSSLIPALATLDFSDKYAKQINDKQTLLQVVKMTDDELSSNLKNRGLDVLFRYTTELK